MSFGMDETGFTKKTLSDVKQSLEEELTAVFGPINSEPESVFGQVIGVWSEASSILWDLAESVYYSQYPISAEGINLDNAVDLTGITRLEASESFAECIFIGDESTLLPLNSQVRQKESDELFFTKENITITKSSCLKIVVTVNTVTDSTLYSVTIAGTLNEINSGSSSSELSILTALEAEILSNMSGYETELNSIDFILTVTVTDKKTPFTSDVSSLLDLVVGTPGDVFSVNKGSISVPASTLINIETPVSGWSEVDNLLSGQAGRDVETDDELRIRRKQSLRVTGAATVPAIEARIFQEVDGVTSVVVKENSSDVVDLEDRPPHSFESIVAGGLDQDIGDKIWEVKPAGIQTYADLTQGGVEVDVVDSEGVTQKILFSRPVDKYVHMNIEISLYDEEQFPINGIELIKEAIVGFGSTFKPGDDLIVQRFYTPIYTVEGILNIVTLEFAITENPGDSTTPVDSDNNDGVGTNKLINTTTSPFITAGVVPGMIVKNVSDSLISSCVKVDSASELSLANNIFTSFPKSYEVGGYGEVNVPFASNELAIFSTGRIQVTIV